ncbi:MAG: formimidoylglutamate deiminase [Actinomycetota bacterium]|nr:formimidoylglutamate deiminase [Actinomycetota bacterium]MDQ2958362.1 formimidoylglutamate deiminase [Actinomycetota bacterium]
MTSYWARYGWLDGDVAEDVRLVAEDGRWAAIARGVPAAGQDVVLPGLVLPAFANTHSHAFHRALRGRTHDGGGTFWTWRERMYALAARLEPESYYLLARAVYAEMALAGVSVVGEFHYLHHRPDGSPYPDPNAFGNALIRAAADAGIRITLLDTCYLAGGLDSAGYQPLSPVQRRFSDGTAERWRDRVAALQGSDQARIGAAVHSVRAVPADQLATVVEWSAGRPLHAHVSEQPAENEVTLAVHGVTPTGLLAGSGFGGPLSTAVHATHLTESDIAWYGASRTNVSFCPTTERDLADGIGPSSELAAAGATLTLGSDQNAVVDLLEEARALELDDRLASLQRGRFTLEQLVHSLTRAGHASLGWGDAGQFTVGQRADLVALRLDTVRTAGALPRQVILAASAVDVDTVLVDGQVVVSGGEHRLGNIGTLLSEAIAPLWA